MVAGRARDTNDVLHGLASKYENLIRQKWRRLSALLSNREPRIRIASNKHQFAND